MKIKNSRPYGRGFVFRFVSRCAPIDIASSPTCGWSASWRIAFLE